MDLTTRYMGLPLKNPLVASASPLTGEPDNIRRLEDAGAAAVVLPSLFQEDIEAEAARYDFLTSAGEDSWPEATTNFPPGADYRLGPKEYLDLVRKASAAVEIPVIASLNGITNEGWISYARLIEEAGAKGLELNIYFIPADLAQSGHDVERPRRGGGTRVGRGPGRGDHGAQPGRASLRGPVRGRPLPGSRAELDAV